MRSSVLILIYLWLCYPAQIKAQSIRKEPPKRFQLEISGGPVIPSGLNEPGLDLGFHLSFEPRYVISSKVKLGIKLESVIMAQNIRSSGEGFRSDHLEQNGYVLTVDYLGNKKRTQHYYGIGIGVVDVTSGDLDPLTPSSQTIQKTTTALMLRTGIEFSENKLRAGVEYFFVGPTTFSENNNYLSFKLGVMLFTRKRKQS